MKNGTMTKLLLTCAAAIAVCAQATELGRVVTDRSQIKFISTQMGVPVQGSFRKFDGDISVDPARPETGRARIEVELDSIDAGSSDADTEVKGKEWFNTAEFPKAVFTSSSVIALGNGRYRAHGRLMIKGISREIVIPFSIRNEGSGAWLEGGFILPRLRFKIGEGAWSDTSTVADDVQVRFKLLLAPS